MRRILGAAAVLVGIAAGAQVGAAAPPRCRISSLEPFALGQPFLLSDPRSGLMLYVESDGRHIAAITREGTVLWHRDLFDDPRLASELVPRQPSGQPPLSDEAWRQWAKSYLGGLSIDRIGVVPDCAVDWIDSRLPQQFRGHYIFAASGTRIEYLLDAKTGDFLEYLVN